MTSHAAIEPNWDDQNEDFLSLENLLLEEPEANEAPLILSDSRVGAEKRQTELMKRIDQLKSRAEMTVTETIRHMKVQKTITQHMQPTMLALFRIEVILDSIATHKEADLTRQAVEEALDNMEKKLTQGENSLDALIRQHVTPDQLRDNPVRFTNPVKMSFTITCQQSRRTLNLLSQLDRVLVKSTILDMFGITDGSSTKRAARKWVGSAISTMRSLINMERNVMRAQYVKRSNEMEIVASEMKFDQAAVDEAKAAAKGDQGAGRKSKDATDVAEAKSKRDEQDQKILEQKLYEADSEQSPSESKVVEAKPKESQTQATTEKPGAEPPKPTEKKVATQ